MSDTQGWASPGQQPGQQPGGHPQQGYPRFPGGGQGYHPDGLGKPGVIPLRPLSVTEILDGSFTTIRRYPAVMLGTSLVVVLITQLISYLFSLTMLDDLNRIAGLVDQPLTQAQAENALLDLFGSTALISVVTGFASVLGMTLLDGLLTVVIGKSILGRPVSFREALGEAKPRLLPLLGLTVLYTLMVFVGLLLCIVPGVFVAVFYGLATPVLVLERAKVGQALKRSGDLVRGTFWRVLGILALATLLTFIIGYVLQTIFGLVAGVESFNSIMGNEIPETTAFGLAMSTLGAVIAATFTAPFSSGVRALTYIDLRMRKEGMDLQLARAAAQPVSPSAPQPPADDTPTPPNGIPMGEAKPEDPTTPPSASTGPENPEPPRPPQ